MDQIGLRVQQHDRNTFGMEDVTHFIPHDPGDGLDIQRLGHGFAHAVEDGEFVHARIELFGAFFDLLLEPLRPLGIIQRHRGLVGQHAQHIAVGLVERAIERIHVHVEVAGDLVLGDQRCNDAAEPGLPGQDQAGGAGQAGCLRCGSIERSSFSASGRLHRPA